MSLKVFFILLLCLYMHFMLGLLLLAAAVCIMAIYAMLHSFELELETFKKRIVNQLHNVLSLSRFAAVGFSRFSLFFRCGGFVGSEGGKGRNRGEGFLEEKRTKTRFLNFKFLIKIQSFCAKKPDYPSLKTFYSTLNVPFSF